MFKLDLEKAEEPESNCQNPLDHQKSKRVPEKHLLLLHWLSLVAQMVRRLPAMWETRVLFLGREDPLEKETAIHSSTPAWKIPWTEEPDRLQSMGSQRVGHDSTTSLSASWTMLKSLIVWITTNWKILKEMGIPDHLTCLLRILYAGQEATVRTRHVTIN